MELNDNFGIPGVLFFDEHDGLVRANISTPAAKATVYLQGRILRLGSPAVSRQVLFLSSKSESVAGKPIRGGVPIRFRGLRIAMMARSGRRMDSHAFRSGRLRLRRSPVRICTLRLRWGPTQLSRDLGFDHFRVAFQLTIGRSLTMQLTVANDAEAPLVFEEALHTYFAVGDVREVTSPGLSRRGLSIRPTI